MKKLWNNYRKLIRLAEEYWVKDSLLDTYNYLKERKYSVKTVVERIKQELNLILNHDEDECNNQPSNKDVNKRSRTK